MLMLIILTVVGVLLPVWLFQWWMHRKYGASPSVMDRLLGDDGYTARWGKKHYRSLHERQPGEAEKRKPNDNRARYPADTRPRVSRLQDNNHDDDAPPVPLSELLSDTNQSANNE